MGALYHLKQKLVDFCNVIQENVSRTDTVPSSKVVYDLKADADADIQELNDSFVLYTQKHLKYTATSYTNFLKQVLDYLITQRAGNYVFSAIYTGSSVNICIAFVQSSGRAVLFCIPQISSTTKCYYAEYNSGSYHYAESARTTIT